MTKAQKELLDRIEKDYGTQGKMAVASLMHLDTIDPCIARRHVVKLSMWDRLLKTRLSKRRLEDELAEDYGVSREAVRNMVSNTAHH